METVIIAFEQEKTARQLADLLESTGTAHCLICASGDQARRLLTRQMVPCVLCGSRLTDGPAEWLYEDLPPFCSLLLIGAQHQLDICANPNIYKLSTPIRRDEVVSTVRLLMQFGRKIQSITKNRRTAGEQALIERAKGYLMGQHQISEDTAHHMLQRYSMDHGLPLKEAAAQILNQTLQTEA